MDTLKWDKVVQAIEAYRACPEQSQLDSLRQVLSDCTLYVPAGDFDGNNAVISPLSSAQGGHFIPLYATRENVRPAQHSEGVRPADWKHILSQMPLVEGCVIEPYSVNFAFDGRFIDALLGDGASDVVDSDVEVLDAEVLDAEVPDGEASSDFSEVEVEAEVKEDDIKDEVSEPAEVEIPVEDEVRKESEPVVHAWPPAPIAEEKTAEREESEEETEVEDSPVESEEPAQLHVSVPDSVPDALNDAVQAVSDELTVPVWLLEVQGAGGERSYLMVLNTDIQWFDACGPDAVNRILSRFSDPGVPLDFAPRESDAGRYAEGKEPQYYPRVNSAVQRSAQKKDAQDKSFFRRLFKL